MVRDIISYAGEVILTIYHKGFDNEVAHRRIRKTEKIGKYNIVFEEEVVEDTILDSLINWDVKTEGLLGSKDMRNPYGERVCAYMVRYLNLDKPKRLFSLQEDKYQLNIPAKHFKQIILFTKKYTGLDLRDQVMSYGDIFIYECHQRNVYAKDDEGIIIEAAPRDNRIIVNFQNDDIVVCTKIIDLEGKGNERIEVLSDREWNSCDVQIYEDKKLVFFKHRISFMHTMVINQALKGNSKKIKLNKLGHDFAIEGKEHLSKSVIGKKPDEIRSLISQSNYFIKQRLAEEEDDTKLLFISPNELERARDYIVSILRLDGDEVWIFDPYFSDRNGMMISLDWIRILAYCKATTKHIVFWNNEAKDPITVDEFVRISSEDRVIKDSKGNRSDLGIHFYQIKTYIHDRFVFAVSKDKVTGIAVGTSLNSLDSNYYCIHTLSNGSARNVYYNLKKLIDDSNIAVQARI
ncbi:MAG: hypothetical protein ACH0QD_07360 [Tepidibacillus sp.]